MSYFGGKQKSLLSVAELPCWLGGFALRMGLESSWLQKIQVRRSDPTTAPPTTQEWLGVSPTAALYASQLEEVVQCGSCTIVCQFNELVKVFSQG